MTEATSSRIELVRRVIDALAQCFPDAEAAIPEHLQSLRFLIDVERRRLVNGASAISQEDRTELLSIAGLGNAGSPSPLAGLALRDVGGDREVMRLLFSVVDSVKELVTDLK